MDKIYKISEYKNNEIELCDLNPMNICETEGEFLARQALLSGDKPNQYYINGCDIYKYKDIPEDKLKWYHIADIYEIKAMLGCTFMRKFKVGKYRGEYIFKIISKDIEYVTWCLRNIGAFLLTDEEIKLYYFILNKKESTIQTVNKS